MPQANSYLSSKWNEVKSWSHLSNNFTEHAGIITPKHGHIPTELDFEAIDYLCQEWDYGYGEQNA
jgi:hypothetical protein